MPFKSIVYQVYNENKHMSVNSHKSSWLKGINNLLKYCSLGDIFTNEIHSINKQEKNNFSNLTIKNVKQMYIYMTGRILSKKKIVNSGHTPYSRISLKWRNIFYMLKTKM